jgi:hypothetical protein
VKLEKTYARAEMSFAKPMISSTKPISHFKTFNALPLTISVSRFVSFPVGIAKKHRLPFNRIKVIVHEAIFVNMQDFDRIGTRVVSAGREDVMSVTGLCR